MLLSVKQLCSLIVFMNAQVNFALHLCYEWLSSSHIVAFIFPSIAYQYAISIACLTYVSFHPHKGFHWIEAVP